MVHWVLALGGSDHDFSAALICDCDIRVAVEQERLSRRKYGMSLWFESPVQRAIDYCLNAEGVTIGDISAVVSSDTIPVRVRNEYRPADLHLFPHHLCHAASAYMMLPRGSKAGIFVYDGFGSIVAKIEGGVRSQRETFSLFVFDGDGYRCLGQTLGDATVEGDDFPLVVTNSVGLLYELVTGVLGYDPLEAGKTMGLASYGTPDYIELLDSAIRYGSTPSDIFQCRLDDTQFAQRLIALLDQAPHSFEARANLAASVQAVINKAALRGISFFHDHGIDHLCVAGGCALNTVTNAHLIEKSELRIPIMAPPHAGDVGLGFGAFWLYEFARTGSVPNVTFRGNPLTPSICRPGRTYSARERGTAVQQFYPCLTLDPTITRARDLARVLSDGEVIGVFNGRSEIGPRALGGRSIMADPLRVSIRERINRTIKRREPYRPFAPIVLERRYLDYFCDERVADPYMLKVARVRDKCVQEAPAVVHIDRTARVQVIRDGFDPFLSELLEEFEAITGRSILLNTSFNRRGEPIVESPFDAIDAFIGMKLDGLYLDGEFYRLAVSSSI